MNETKAYLLACVSLSYKSNFRLLEYQLIVTQYFCTRRSKSHDTLYNMKSGIQEDHTECLLHLKRLL